MKSKFVVHWKKDFLYDFIEVLIHFVTIYALCYRKENICKHLNFLSNPYVQTFFCVVPCLFNKYPKVWNYQAFSIIVQHLDLMCI